MAYRLMTPRFPVGRIVATPAVLTLGLDLDAYIHRHHCGDWGDLDAEDKQANEEALNDGARLLSCYHVGNGRRIYIITEWDRGTTILLLPEEY